MEIIVALIGVAVALLFLAGLLLWWPARRRPEGRSELGAALLGGAAVAFAVLVVQLQADMSLDRQAERLERVREEVVRQETIFTAVGLQHDLTGADLHSQDLSFMYLRGKVMVQANLSNARLIGALLIDADLTDAVLNGAALPRANLKGATLTGANLAGANLAGANLIQADMTDTVSRGADFGGADLRGAILAGADLVDAKLAEATLTGASFDSLTQWPVGFDPVAAGAVKEP